MSQDLLFLRLFSLFALSMTVLRVRNPFLSEPIEIDRNSSIDGLSVVQQRLDRIAANYAQLESILENLEQKIESDGRLAEINNKIGGAELEQLSSVHYKNRGQKQGLKSVNRRNSRPIRKPK